MQQRDSLGYTLVVAAVLCVACSLAVSAAVVSLRPRQEANEQLDQQINILDATGLALGEFGKQAQQLDQSQISELNKWVSQRLVNLETGEYTEEVDIAKYNMLEAAASAELGVDIVDPKYDPGEPRRPKVMKVFLVQRPGADRPQQVVLPVYGKGLWGTLYGYLAVRSDGQTVQGITFYLHKETPGLGGEVDNPSWKSQWLGRKLYDEQGEPAALVYKGPAPPDNLYAVDGLSGATITGRGVTTLVRYWASDDGYGPFLKNFAAQSGGEASSAEPGENSP
jgi:Na+-transporting NADH:ubiquinone oxidoreductase subunit C